jgi:hypothetical protein
MTPRDSWPGRSLAMYVLAKPAHLSCLSPNPATSKLARSSLVGRLADHVSRASVARHGLMLGSAAEVGASSALNK